MISDLEMIQVKDDIQNLDFRFRILELRADCHVIKLVSNILNPQSKFDSTAFDMSSGRM